MISRIPRPMFHSDVPTRLTGFEGPRSSSLPKLPCWQTRMRLAQSRQNHPCFLYILNPSQLAANYISAMQDLLYAVYQPAIFLYIITYNTVLNKTILVIFTYSFINQLHAPIGSLLRLILRFGFAAKKVREAARQPGGPRRTGCGFRTHACCAHLLVIHRSEFIIDQQFRSFYTPSLTITMIISHH